MSSDPTAPEPHRLSDRLAKRRDRHMERSKLYRILFGIAASVVVAIGVVLVPLPGPGWAIVFVGLGMLALEFTWAERLLTKVLNRAESAQQAAAAASPAQKALAGVATALGIAAFVVAAILWNIPLVPLI